MLVYLKGGGGGGGRKGHRRPQHVTRIKNHVQMQNNAMFRFIYLRIGHALLKYRFSRNASGKKRAYLVAAQLLRNVENGDIGVPCRSVN